jgi:hypothetical protein
MLLLICEFLFLVENIHTSLDNNSEKCQQICYYKILFYNNTIRVLGYWVMRAVFYYSVCHMVPVGPVGPVIPLGPVGPVSPVGPVIPLGPV